MPLGERFAYSFQIKVLTAPAGQPNSSDRTGGRFKNYNMCFSPCQEEIEASVGPAKSAPGVAGFTAITAKLPVFRHFVTMS